MHLHSCLLRGQTCMTSNINIRSSFFLIFFHNPVFEVTSLLPLKMESKKLLIETQLIYTCKYCCSNLPITHLHCPLLCMLKASLHSIIVNGLPEQIMEIYKGFVIREQYQGVTSYIFKPAALVDPIDWFSCGVLQVHKKLLL